MKGVMLSFAGALLLAPALTSAAGVDCEPARCAVQAAINTACPCTSATNHGQHVSCVARVVRTMVGDGPGQVPVNCKGKVVRCAARSTCGKEGFVTCQIPVPGTCDTVAHTCLNDPTKACFTDAECTTFKCKVKSATELCTAAGGTVGTSSTCCAACGS